MVWRSLLGVAVQRVAACVGEAWVVHLLQRRPHVGHPAPVGGLGGERVGEEVHACQAAGHSDAGQGAQCRGNPRWGCHCVWSGVPGVAGWGVPCVRREWQVWLRWSLGRTNTVCAVLLPHGSFAVMSKGLVENKKTRHWHRTAIMRAKLSLDAGGRKGLAGGGGI